MTERAEEYQFYKRLKICVRCHKNQAEPNRVMCLECIGADSDYRKKKRKCSDTDELEKKDLHHTQNLLMNQLLLEIGFLKIMEKNIMVKSV